MPKQLTIDDMLEVLQRIDHPTFPGFKAVTETLANSLGFTIADALKLHFNEPATFQGIAFGGTCAPICPLADEDPVPEVLEDIDPGADWCTMESFLAALVEG